MISVWVQNTGSDTVHASWDGVSYTLSPDMTVEVPLFLAQTYLGYEMEDKGDSLARLGWIKFANDIPDALVRLSAFRVMREPPDNRRSLSPATVRTLPVVSKKATGSVSALDAAKA